MASLLWERYSTPGFELMEVILLNSKLVWIICCFIFSLSSIEEILILTTVILFYRVFVVPVGCWLYLTVVLLKVAFLNLIY